MMHYKFALCLPGKGIDTYRTWESLTLGVIPVILKTNHMDCLYDNLPVVLINSVDEINTEFLEKEFQRISSEIDTYKFHKLSSSFWIDLIFHHVF